MNLYEIESRIRVLRQTVERTADSGALRKAVKQAIAGMSQIEADIPDEPVVVPVPVPVPEPVPPTNDLGAITGMYYTYAPSGLKRENGQRVQLLDLLECRLLASGPNVYGLYLSPCDRAVLTKCAIESAYYAVRGTFEHWSSVECTFTGGHAWRVYGLHSGTSIGDTFRVERLMLGGGAADEAIDPQPFENFVFDSCTIDTRRPSDIYPASHHITFRNCGFVNAGVSIWGGAHDVVFEGCKVSESVNGMQRIGPLEQRHIKLGKDSDGVQHITWNNAHERGIVIK